MHEGKFSGLFLLFLLSKLKAMLVILNQHTNEDESNTVWDFYGFCPVANLTYDMKFHFNYKFCILTTNLKYLKFLHVKNTKKYVKMQQHLNCISYELKPIA